MHRCNRVLEYLIFEPVHLNRNVIVGFLTSNAGSALRMGSWPFIDIRFELKFTSVRRSECWGKDIHSTLESSSGAFKLLIWPIAVSCEINIHFNIRHFVRHFVPTLTHHFAKNFIDPFHFYFDCPLTARCIAREASTVMAPGVGQRFGEQQPSIFVGVTRVSSRQSSRECRR